MKNPLIGGKKETPLVSEAKPRKCFEVASSVTNLHKPCVEHPNFSAALDREASGSRRLSGHGRRAAPVFQFGKKVHFNHRLTLLHFTDFCLCKALIFRNAIVVFSLDLA